MFFETKDPGLRFTRFFFEDGFRKTQLPLWKYYARVAKNGVPFDADARVELEYGCARLIWTS